MKLTPAEGLKMIEDAPDTGAGDKIEMILSLARHMTNADYTQLMDVLHDLNLRPGCPVCAKLRSE